VPVGEGIRRYNSCPEQGSLSVARAMAVFQQMLFDFRFADRTNPAWMPDSFRLADDPPGTLLWLFHNPCEQQFDQPGWHGPSCISARLRCRRCSLTSTKRGAINCSQMFRTVRVALALLSIFSIAYVLITPAATDDVTAVSQRSHFGKAQKLAVCLVQPLAPQIAIFRLPTPSSSNQRLTTLELVDLFRTYRC
jgi:hypothetical protein